MQTLDTKTLFAFFLTLTGCGSARDAGLPTRAGPPLPAEVTIVWAGFGECERFEDGAWRRRPEFDYEFTVEQRRYADHWESVKHMRRRHPDYDGSAGPREQTLHFFLTLAPATDSEVAIRIESSLGPGEGRSDRDFRAATLTFHPDVSKLAPFDTYRIEQTYGYERGRLDETVRLDKGDTPWVRNNEHATLFAPHTFERAPTTR